MAVESQNCPNAFDRVLKKACVCLSYFCAKAVAVK